MAEHLLDTNVLSKIFYGDLDVKKFVDGLDAGIETVVYIELIQGSLGKADREKIKRALSKLPYFPLNSDIALNAIQLIDKYSASRGLFLADALIAATALYYDLALVTFNIMHFNFIKGLNCIKP
jgi:predicted nucleic acid-binding protein